MKKHVIYGVLAFASICSPAFAMNEIRVDAPVLYVEPGQWMAAAPLLGQPFNVREDCASWAPATDGMPAGAQFEQSRLCTVTSSQSVQQREVYSTTGVYRNVGEATLQDTSVQETQTQQAVGSESSDSGFTIINPVPGRDGIYTVKSGSQTFDAYVNMSMRGGNWVLVARWTSLVNASFNDVVVRNQPLKSLSNDPVNYPVIPAGIINSSDKALIVNSNPDWVAAYGTWQQFQTLPVGTKLNGKSISAIGPSGVYSFYHPQSGWSGNQDMAQSFGLWPTNNYGGDSNLCGGAGKPGKKRMCPVLGSSYGQHGDSTNEKRLYLKAQ